MPVVGLVVVGTLLGVFGRDQLLSVQVRRREERILAEFPAVAELLALSVGAGLLKGVTDTVTVIKEPNAKGRNVTLIAGQGIGSFNDPRLIPAEITPVTDPSSAKMG